MKSKRLANLVSGLLNELSDLQGSGTPEETRERRREISAIDKAVRIELCRLRSQGEENILPYSESFLNSEGIR